jgi:hypothetical protein
VGDGALATVLLVFVVAVLVDDIDIELVVSFEAAQWLSTQLDERHSLL